jgi:hypothetical protein
MPKRRTTMTKLLTALAALAILATVIPANAGSHCTTTCNGYGNTRTCNTYCY